MVQKIDMRVIIPNYCLPDSFVDNVAHTLRSMGHEVFTAPKPVSLIDKRLYHILQGINDKFAPAKLSYQEKWLRKVYREIKPQIVLSLTQVLNEELLCDLRKSGVVTISWWGDTAANMTKYGLLCEGWDFIFIKDKYAAFKLQTMDLNAFYLPEAMNPDWHLMNYTTINDSLLFAGNTYDYRHYLVRKLAAENKFSIKLYGNRPPRWAHPSVKNLFLDKFIIKEEKSREFGAALACINSTAMSEGNSLNCRTFELAGAGALQIIEYRQAVEDCFDPGKEILTYSSFGELLGHIERVQKDKNFANSIRMGAYNRAKSEHTYSKRLNTIFDTIKA